MDTVPLIEFEDACGKGQGARGITVIDQVGGGINGGTDIEDDDTDITEQTYDITDVQGIMPLIHPSQISLR